jgi:hypothetical protein
MFEYEWHDLAGNIGVVCILVTYLLLQLEKLSPTSLLYSALNAVGATLVVYSLLFEFNLSAFAIEVCWLAISLFGIGRQLMKVEAV